MISALVKSGQPNSLRRPQSAKRHDIGICGGHPCGGTNLLSWRDLNLPWAKLPSAVRGVTFVDGTTASHLIGQRRRSSRALRD